MATRKPFAHGTDISADRSRAEIRKLLERIGATRFLFGSEDGREVVSFDACGHRVRFEIPVPPGTDEKEIMRLYRGLTHRVKSKVITVEENIAEFEEEFLNELVMPNNQTLGDYVRPQLAIQAQNLPMPALLPGVLSVIEGAVE